MAEETQKINERPPVVVVLGHVDHGKTSLLDWIRKTKVAEKEAGGITQSIGAYEIEVRPSPEPKSRESEANRGIPRQTPRAFGSETQARRDDFAKVRKITFIDTPGHEAFRAMRKRGATVADIAILVVASDDGVKPQTEESLKILKETNTPFVVAITKIDSSRANIQKTQNELLAKGILLEGYGGDVSWQAVSSKTGEGINELLDLVLLLGEVSGLTYDSLARAKGFIIELKKDSRRGTVVSAIIKDGLLKKGRDICTATASGKIKILENFLGQPVPELAPSSPALIVGFENLPKIGEEFMADEVKIFELIPKENLKTQREKDDGSGLPPAILKADVAGSLEVLSDILGDKLRIIEASAGEITDGDVKSAIANKAIMVSFRARPNKAAENLIRNHKVRLFSSEVIYELVKTVEEYLEGSTAPAIAGRLKVLAIFSEKGAKRVIGGKVAEGALKTGRKTEISRNGEILGEGRIINLQKNKEDVREVEAGNECGILIDSEVIIKAGDEISQREVE